MVLDRGLRNVFMWLGARMSWPLQDIWPVELTILRYYQSKTLQLRLTNGEVMTYDFWRKRATESIRSRRHIFKEGCSCLLLNHFVPSEVGVLVSSLTFLQMKDGSGFRKSIFFIWIHCYSGSDFKKMSSRFCMLCYLDTKSEQHLSQKGIYYNKID